jgi:hypothetical protein
MPLERRDPNSKAKLFIPTTREQHLVKSQRLLDKSLEEVEKLKKDLTQLIKEAGK